MGVIPPICDRLLNFQTVCCAEAPLARDPTLCGVDRTIGGRNLLFGSVEIVRDLPRNLAVATFFDIGNAFNRES